MRMHEVSQMTIQNNYELNREGEEYFHGDLIAALHGDYGFNVEQAEAIYEVAYEHGHSAGYYEVYGYASEFADLIERVSSLA